MQFFFNLSFLKIKEAVLKVYDGGSDRDILLNFLTGNNLPATISSSGNQMFISFNRTGNEVVEGFLISFTFGKAIERFSLKHFQNGMFFLF